MISMSSRRAYLAAVTLTFGLSLVSSASAFRVLHKFAGGGDGAYPQFSNIVEFRNGDLYGVTSGGGDATCQCGIVFKLTHAGDETVLYRFMGGNDGAVPYGGLEKGTDGNLYGVTTQGGGGPCMNGCGTVFQITPEGIETVIHRFAGGTDGSVPYARLHAGKHGILYGTTLSGGDATCQCGTVFRITPGGAKTILHSFAGATDGASPQSPLVEDQNGNLFGSTSAGGASTCNSAGCGTIYEVAANGGERVLHAFQGNDGSDPLGAMVIDADGNLYGAANQGGEQALGNVFKVASDGTLSVLHYFTNGDGYFPSGGVTSDGKGRLYGTTDRGGSICDCGIIFAVGENASQGNGYGVDYVFGTPRGPVRSWLPDNALHVDKRGHVYGIAAYGVRNCSQYGCVFSVGALGT